MRNSIEVSKKDAVPNQMDITLPGDKAIIQRATILAALSDNKVKIYNVAYCDDVKNNIDILKQLGVSVVESHDYLDVYGVGKHGLKQPQNNIFVGNSATTTRIITAVLSGYMFNVNVLGNEILTTRSMSDYFKCLLEMGSTISYLGKDGHLPIKVQGTYPLKGITIRPKIDSAQLKSTILYAGLFSNSPVKIRCNAISRDHTENLFKYYGLNLQTSEKLVITLTPNKTICAKDIIVPGDFSAAAFFITFFLLKQKQIDRLIIKDVGLNPTRTGFLSILNRMGAKYRFSYNKQKENEFELSGDLFFDSCNDLHGIRIDRNDNIQTCIDEIPLIACLASQAKGDTYVHDCDELRNKDTNRIETTIKMLDSFGIKSRLLENGFVIFGEQKFKNGIADSYGDHRIAMASILIAGTLKEASIIKNIGCISVSYPTFFKDICNYLKFIISEE